MGFFSSIGNAVSSAASAVGDVVEDVVDAVVDTVEDAVDTVTDAVQSGIESATDWLCDNAGSVGCFVGNVVGGLIGGFVKGFSDIMHGIFDVVRDLGGIVGSILRLDLPGLLKNLGNLVQNVFDLGIDGLRFATGGYAVGGIVDKFKRSELRKFVEQLVDDTFGDNPERLDRVRKAIGLEGKRFGFRLPSKHLTFYLDSDNIPLWRMHKDGIIDLYAMAGLLSFNSFSLGIAHPNTVVKSVSANGEESAWPVNRYIISKYLESEGREKRIRVYSISKRVVSQMLDTAARKLDDVGVILEWNDRKNFSWFGGQTGIEVTENEYDMSSNRIESLLGQPEYGRQPNVNCSLIALGAFKLDNFGRVGGRDIFECENFPDDCETEGRDDDCCITVERDVPSGVIYRDVYPTDTFQYILAHEIGHYLGLCHCGHDGFQNIMYTSKSLNFFDPGIVSLYWDSEPHFSLKDGKNVWRFIVDQLRPCLTGEPEVIAIDDVVRTRRSSLNSCAVVREEQKSYVE